MKLEPVHATVRFLITLSWTQEDLMVLILVPLWAFVIWRFLW